MLQLQTLRQQLLQLLQEAQKFDQQTNPNKPQHWFDSELFSSHSPLLADYVSEALLSINRLEQQHTSASSRQQRVARLGEQVDALTKAFANISTRRKYQATSKPRVQNTIQQLNNSSQSLYQQLSEYQQFERRLQDMLHDAQQRHANTEHILALHARLGRCRKAISETEHHILLLEKR